MREEKGKRTELWRVQPTFYLPLERNVTVRANQPRLAKEGRGKEDGREKKKGGREDAGPGMEFK